MNKKSTPNEHNDCCSTLKSKKEQMGKGPGKQTLSLILQFAYSYHVEKKLPAAMSGMVLN